MSKAARWRSCVRWLKFNLVGAIGMAVQLSLLWLLTALGTNYLLATALAVEAAVLHNFCGHECFTWVDRRYGGIGKTLGRFARFNLTTGAISIGGNLALMRWLVGAANVRPLPANVIAVAVCSILNFLVSDRWVFQYVVHAD